MKKLPEEIKTLKIIGERLDKLMSDSYTSVEINSSELYEYLIKKPDLKRKFYTKYVFTNFLRNQHEKGILKQIIKNYRVNISKGNYAWHFWKKTIETKKSSIDTNFERNTPKFIKNGLKVDVGIEYKLRSKQEKLIYEKLIECDYLTVVYEHPLIVGNQKTKYVDFYIINNLTKKEFYWEHFGMTNSDRYLDKMTKTIKWYNDNGFKNIDEGGDLIYTIYKDEKTLGRDIEKYLDLIKYTNQYPIKNFTETTNLPFIEIFISFKYRKRIDKGGYYVILKYKNHYKEFKKLYKYSNSINILQNAVLLSLNKINRKAKVVIYTSFNFETDRELNTTEFRSKIDKYTEMHEINFYKVDKLKENIDFEICEKKLIQLLQ